LSPNGSSVFYLADVNEDGKPYFNNNLFVVPSTGGDARMLLPEMPYEIDDASWSADGRSIYFIANTGVRNDLFSVDVDSGEYSRLSEGDHTIGDWQYRPSLDAHVSTLSTPDNPGDVWQIRDGEFSRLTHVFEQLAEDYFLPRQEAISWKGADGVTVEGLLYYPRDYEQDKRYPLAVQTHGGPAASDKFRYPGAGSYQQILTDRGWLVFRPNYRGSVGYGDPFLRDMVGHYFNQSHLDVMTGVDHLIDLGLADPERMIKMGWSGGGHMTNKIITHTDRFKAASSGAGAANWISMYGQTDIRIHRENWFGGSPWEKDAPIEKFWEASALREIWKVKTPTLVLVGEKDERVPAPQSVELYRALKTNGVDTHLYMAPREPHGWKELRHQLFKVNVELEWFERHALGREYEWQMAPEEKDDEPVAEQVTGLQDD
jgi:dipeptidyl aminopeptidase/acylaminoacyl peptidase